MPNLDDIDPIALAGCWPAGLMPLAMWGINGERTVVPLALKPVRPSDFFGHTLQNLGSGQTGFPKYVGLIPYDEFCPVAERKAATLIYEIHESLVWTHGSAVPERVVSGKPKDCALRLDPQTFKNLLKETAEFKHENPKGVTLHSGLSDESYLSLVHDVQTAIRAGRYYQLNLLRWFRPSKAWSWQQVCSRLSKHGGPFSSLFRHGNTAVASFSPERFVKISRSTDGAELTAWPIKGTVARDLTNSAADDIKKEMLKQSQKDQAELHMIVDLMRNDLNRVCHAQSVEVTNPGSVKTFGHVHHLQASVKGSLDTKKTLGEIFTALCPGGSITGAPKVEVMRHIHALEGRERGYMMGNAFLMDGDGALDSSILIRTMVSQDAARSWEYAAGSGIVIKSKAEQELTEVRSKCRPLTD